MTKKTKILLFVILAVFFLYFSWRSALFLDPDFGWHLRMGKLLLEHGIPSGDPFSYTMPSYPVVRHEWFTEIIIAKVLAVPFGYTLLGLLFGLLTVSAFSLQLLVLSDKAKRFAPIFLLLALLAISGFVGIRTQLVTWMFFSLLLFMIRDSKRFLRFGFLLPLLFAFWVNLHGGFAIGVIALALATGVFLYKMPSKRVVLLSIFIASLAATFVTPYGYRSWWEVWMTMSDKHLHWTIQEWIPTIFILIMPFWVFVVFSLMFVGRYLRRFSLLDILLYGVLFLAALSAARHVPLWLLVALPMTIESIAFFHQDIKKIHFGERRFFFLGKFFFVGVCLFCLFELQSIGYAFGLFDKKEKYPENAIHYLQNHLPKDQVFSVYDWGGYLIWKFPEKKVFIDGRMPVWRREEKIAGESSNAFQEYRDFMDGKRAFSTVTRRYGIDTLLLPLPQDEKTNPLNNLLISFWTNVLHLPFEKDEGVLTVVKEAQKAGWILVYKDETAQIYQKPYK